MSPDMNLIPWIFVWLVVATVLFSVMSLKKFPTAGLLQAYWLSASVNHFFGAAIYTLPWYDRPDYAYVYQGFLLTNWGMISFAIGNLFFSFAMIPFLRKNTTAISFAVPDERLALTYLWLGAVLFFVVYPILKSVPSIGLIGSSGWYLMIAGICLASVDAWRLRKGGKLIRWIFLAIFFPFVTVVSQGFMSFGVRALFTIMAFISSFYRPRWKIIAASFLFIYFGLSLYVTYFRDRSEIRETVWYEQVSLAEKAEKFLNTLKNYELFDINNETHLDFINQRLNQNILVGKSIEYIGSGLADFAGGRTVGDAMIGLVPRILWPEKPVVAGGSDLVSQYTGEIFQEDTSVGIGQVMEFFVNFGFQGVVIGFFSLGVMISFFDFMAGSYLRKGNYKGFVFWFISGMSFLQIEGSLVEISSTLAASLISVALVNKYALGHMPERLITVKALREFLHRRKRV